MAKKSLWFKRNGYSLIPADSDSEHELEKISNNAMVRVNIHQPRSYRSNGLFFSFLAHVYENWPSNHAFRPRSEEHLRAWLLYRIGHVTEITFDTSGTDSEAVLAAKVLTYYMIEQEGRYVWAEASGSLVTALSPKSMRFDTLDESAFRELAEKVYNLIDHETWISVNEFKKLWPDKR